MKQPVRLSLDLLGILADSEVWIIPRPDCPSHPYAIAFYVPAEATADLTRCASLARALQRPAARRADLRLVR